MEEVKIEKLDHQGRGIGRLKGIVTFIPYALPGEIVKIKPVKIKKKYIEGEIVSFIKKSPERIEPVCPYFSLCGGCSLMHTKDEEEYKNEMIKDIFNRYLNENIKINPIQSFERFNYRNKIILQVKDKIGFYKNNSNEIIEIDKCLLADNKINKILKELKKNLNTKDISKIVIRASKNTSDTMITIDDKNADNKPYIKEKLGDYTFLISSGSFFQTNTLVAQKLYDEIIRLGKFNKNDKVLDLYCGTGTIGIYISKHVKEVLGIEIVKEAIKDANNNKKINNIPNISFICGDVGNILGKQDNNFDVIIVDPPRKGLGRKTIVEILKLKPKKVIYVSCNPLTLVRDLNLLKDEYEIKEVSPFNMFPNTYHVECVCVLELK